MQTKFRLKTSALLGVAFTVGAFAQSPRFEVASVKLNPTLAQGAPIHFGPDSLRLISVDLRLALVLAYGVRDFQVEGPDWLRDSSGSYRFNVEAKASHPVPSDQLFLMLRSLLADRFHLTLHHEQKEMPVIAMRVMSSGMKFKPFAGAAPPDTQWLGFSGVSVTFSHGRYVLSNAPMDTVATVVGNCAGNVPPLVDQTGLKGRFDLTFRALPPPPPDMPKPTADDKLAACNLIVQQDLGLTLNRARAPVDILVVDHADKAPTEN